MKVEIIDTRYKSGVGMILIAEVDEPDKIKELMGETVPFCGKNYEVTGIEYAQKMIYPPRYHGTIGLIVKEL